MSVNYFKVELRYTGNSSNHYRISEHLLLFHCPDMPAHTDTPGEYFTQALRNTMRTIPRTLKLGSVMKRIKSHMAACDVTFLGEKVIDSELNDGRVAVWKPRWTKMPAGLSAEPFGDGPNRMERHNGIKGSEWALAIEDNSIMSEPMGCTYKQRNRILKTFLDSHRAPYY